MPSPEIEEFAKLLVREVRDAAIESCEVALRPNAVNPVAKRRKEAARDENAGSIVSVVVPDTVDKTVSYLLHGMTKES
jgi:hypothetical protein